MEINKNSFDIISLIAAVDVMVAHTVAHSSPGGGADFPFWRFIAPAPAVAVMFAISGFLVTASYEKCPRLLDFYKKRVLRIYPLLIVAVTVPVIIYFGIGLLPYNPVQITIECLKTIFIGSFGKYTIPVGAIGNGSLWTIIIQIQFYFLTPIIFKLLRSRKVSILIFIGAIVENLLSVKVEQVLTGTIARIYSLSCLPYLYMYLFGAIIYIHREILLGWLEKYFWLFCMGYGLIHWGIALDLRFDWKYINPISALLVMGIAIGAAFKFGSHRLKIDLSYGIYLWHLPVFDFIHVVLKMKFSICYLLIVWMATFAIAGVSNRYIEKPIFRYVGQHQFPD